MSQLPVLGDNESIIGLLDEEDLLLAVHEASERFADPVSLHMTFKLDIIDPSMDIESLFPIFKSGKVAIVQQHSTFLGLITRVDLLNHHQKQNPLKCF
ncbi:MAG: hypothetical protein MK488_02625 [SAR324 cluster bacterium]|nr:hypothetical protein [SAR324 cluster bacterium]